jgi:hypothetical protein
VAFTRPADSEVQVAAFTRAGESEVAAALTAVHLQALTCGWGMVVMDEKALWSAHRRDTSLHAEVRPAILADRMALETTQTVVDS